jgi:DNA-directed RNA polymerase subunit RPC12/RpoP
VRGPDKLPRKLRPAPVRDGTTPTKRKPRPEQRRAYRVNTIARGLCAHCYKPRGTDGTPTSCRDCAYDAQVRCMTRFDRRRAAGECLDCGKTLPATVTLKDYKLRCQECRDRRSTRARELAARRKAERGANAG